MKTIIDTIKSNWKQYLIILVAGMILGWILFGGGGETTHSHEGHDHESETAAATSWTCSMHPQIQAPEPGDCPICGMDLIPMDAGTANANPAVIEMTETSIKLANIQTTKVEMGLAEKEIRLQGKVEIDERRIASQSIHFNGRIEELHVNFEGEKVKKGQTLAVVYAPQLVTAQQELFQALKTAERYPELVQAARNKLKLWKLTDAQIENIEKSGLVQEYFPIKADVSGYVIKRKVAEGNYVKTGTVLFEIADLNRLWVIFDAYEKDIPFLKEGDEIEFTVASLPRETFTASVNYIDPVLDPQRRIARVRTEVGNRNGMLKPEMHVDGIVSASLNFSEEGLIVPKSAVMWTGKRSVVYVKHPENPAFEMREVVLGESLGEHYLVAEGLEAGELVVSSGAFTVDAAAQLNSKYSMMNRPESEGDIPNLQTKVKEGFRKQLNGILSAYLVLKDELVKTDAATSQAASKKLMMALMAATPDKTNLKGSAKKFWQEQYKILHEELAKMTKSTDVEVQRAAFKPFNNSLILSFKSFGVGQQKMYIQFCPMADNDTGGYWLSTEEQIMNPYFGDMMLHCGEVSETLKMKMPKEHKGHDHQH
ncbi:MAG: efflux RND transporter periplasmic adaptor subunit [Marinifilaceae bacterium]